MLRLQVGSSRGSGLDISVFRADQIPRQTRLFRQGFGYRDGAVFPPRTANPHIEVGLTLCLVFRQEEGEEVGIPGYEFLGFWGLEDVVSYLRIPPSLLS